MKVTYHLWERHVFCLVLCISTHSSVPASDVNPINFNGQLSAAVAVPWKSKIILFPFVSGNTVDGRNPAPVEVSSLLLFTRFYTSQVLKDFSHQQYHVLSIFTWIQFLCPETWNIDQICPQRDQTQTFQFLEASISFSWYFGESLKFSLIPITVSQ